jgi:CDP-L-myo-inositol myo-inositolphosphotransferase
MTTLDTPAASGTLLGLLVPGDSALERVAGVEVTKRAAIVLRRAGCTAVAVSAPAEVRSTLERDPRVGALAAVESLGDDPTAVAMGDVAFPVGLVEELRARAGAGAAVAANGSGLVFVGPGPAARKLLREHERGGVAAATAALGPGTVRVESPALLETQGSAARAAATRAVLRATGKPVDGPLTRLFERRISQTISSVLLAWPVSPNAMTTVSLGIGLTGAALLATTDYTLRVVGAALFVFATIVDGCDGEIARSKFLESGFGKLYDTSVDIAVNAAVFVALGVGTWRELQGVAEVRSAALLLVAGGILAMAVVESVRRLAPVVGPGSLLGRAQAWVEWFATVEWCYIVLGLALIDELPFFFFGAAIGANVFAAVFLAIGVLAWLRG